MAKTSGEVRLFVRLLSFGAPQKDKLMRRLICKLFHNAVMYGGGGEYVCRRCGCRWPVPWVAAVARKPEGWAS